ncbi:MAG: adenylate/guanylate cyclase domain-containing protein [Planctomycetes bacterium]|nr:adenylate/guanylate cyclase domain-containing protein [Planctomycetota bacterium]
MRRIVVMCLLALFAFLLTMAAAALGAIDRLEVLTLDARFALGVGRQAPGDDIVIAWIDQESMDYMDQNGVPFPWPREVYGQVLQHLRQAGARVVAFDVLFDQRGNAEDDRAFGEVLAAAKGDALAMKFVGFRDGGRDGDETAAFAARALPLGGAGLARERERGVVLPIAELAAGADRLGFVNIKADADGTFRRYDLLRAWGPAGQAAAATPSLALAALLAAQPEGELRRLADGRLSLPLGSTIACPDDARLLLNLRGPAFSFAKVKFVNILESINRVENGEPPLYPADCFRDKFVFVGIHAEGYEDAHPTPLDAHLPGVELHATALDNLLRMDPLRVPAWQGTLAAVASALAVAIVFNLPGVWWPAMALLVALGLGLGAASWAWSALLAVPLAAPLVAGGSASAAAFLWRFFVEGRQKRAMHRAFQSYLAPEVLAEVLADPAALRLGGETREVTLFFTDLQGFTTLAERSEPQQLVAFLNDYFTRMCAPVLAQRGIIDKFIGDAIMAIFGTPLATPGHGRAAVLAALDAIAVSEAIAGELRQRGLPPIGTRIGVHKGLAVVGNMGSAARFDYTAIGDTVNLAARLEGANKAFGTRCLVSGTAWADVGDLVLGREVGRVAVVGRHEPIAVFEPLVRREAASDADRQLAATWARAIAALRRGDRETARAEVAACAKHRPQDALASLWTARLADPAFDGVFHLDHK